MDILFFLRLVPIGALLFITILFTEHIFVKYIINFLPPPGFKPGSLGTISR